VQNGKISVSIRYFVVLHWAYVDAGEAGAEVTITPGTSLSPVSIRQSVQYEASGIEVSGLGQYPVTDKFYVLARLGVIYVERQQSSRVALQPVLEPGQPPFGFIGLPIFPAADTKKSTFKPVIGAGIQYQVFEAVAARLEWTRYQDAIDLGNSENDIDSFTVGFRYQF
jgi:opacity protein-like surface antigen